MLPLAQAQTEWFTFKNCTELEAEMWFLTFLARCFRDLLRDVRRNVMSITDWSQSLQWLDADHNFLALGPQQLQLWPGRRKRRRKRLSVRTETSATTTSSVTTSITGTTTASTTTSPEARFGKIRQQSHFIWFHMIISYYDSCGSPPLIWISLTVIALYYFTYSLLQLLIIHV